MEGKTESPAQKWNRAMKLVEDALAVLGEIRSDDLVTLTKKKTLKSEGGKG